MCACLQVLVTDDFASASPYMNVAILGVGIRHIVEFLVVVNLATTLPLLVLPFEDIVMSVLHKSSCAQAESGAQHLRMPVRRCSIVFGC
jgi:hypothetical protein